MRRPGGYLTITSPDRVVERDSFTCLHCNAIVIVEPMCAPEDVGGMCKCCMKLICKRCVAKGGCDPLEEKLKRIEASYHARRSYAGA